MVRPRPSLSGIAVFGGGQVAFLCAIALKRSLPGTDVAIIEMPVRPDALADTSHATLPSLLRFHDRIGIDEPGMVSRAGATHWLATRYSGWRGDRRDWSLGFGAAANCLHESCAEDARLQPISAAAAMAEAGRFARPSNEATSPLSDLDYALRFSPPAYLKRLRSLANHLGISFGPGTPEHLLRGSRGGIERVILADGRQVGADFFVDCSGPAASLFELAKERQREDWSAQLPGSAIIESALLPPRISPLNQVIGTGEGYRILSPGRSGTRSLFVYSSLTADETAMQQSPSPGTVVRLDPGRLAQPWRHNLVAIGDSAALFEPLGWLNLHLALAQISLLTELLPGQDIEPLERSEYVRRANLTADRIRDFIAAHFCSGEKWIGSFGERVRCLASSDSLRLTLSEYSRRGRLPYFEEDSISADMWKQVLRGIGLPAQLPPRLRALPPEERDAITIASMKRVHAAAEAGTDYRSWLEAVLRRSG